LTSRRGQGTPQVAVSVVVASWNYGRFLRQAIESLRVQTLENWECIVVDDGSTDDSQEVLAELAATEPRLHAVAQSHAGVSSARNAGLRRAQGEFIQFLDVDDLLHPEKLAVSVRALREARHLDGVVGPTTYFDDDAGVPAQLRDRPVQPETPGGDGELDLPAFLYGNPITIEAPMTRRSLIERAGGFDETLRLMEDWDLWLRCLIHGARFVLIDSSVPLAFVRVHQTQASRRLEEMLISEIGVRRKVAKLLQRESDRALNDQRIDDARAQAGWLIGIGGDPAAGLRYVVPAAMARRHPRWFAWIAALMVMKVPGGSTFVRVVREAVAGRRARVQDHDR
jgi:glycosyltransferase involved in cell wall biosynthesis